MSFGASNGITLNASANRGKGNADGEDAIQRNTHIVAGNTVRIESGADTTLAGAAVDAKTVQADVGADLHIVSRQDTSTFQSDQKSSGWGVSLCIPPICYGASSVSASSAAQNIESDFASVTEQSGIKAGDGGFQVNVKGDTTLVGGAITSSDKAIEENRNRFETGGDLKLSDVKNHAEYKAEGYALSATVAVGGADKNDKPTPEQKEKAPAVAAKNEGSAGIGEDSGRAESTTLAAISGVAGNKAARTGDAETGIQPIFDKNRVQKEIDAQIKITAEFGKAASKAVGDYATQKYNELKASDPDEAAKWDEGGVYRVMAHALVGGLTGGTAGALGAGAAALSADALNKLTEDMPIGVRNAVGAAVAAGIGAVTGGTAGAVTAFNADMNNRQLHPTEAQWIKDNAKRYAQQRGISEEEAQRQLARQAYRQVQFGAEGDWDPSASAFLSQAKGMLPPEGASGPGYMFFATPQQKASMQMYVDSLPVLANFYIANDLKLPDAQTIAASLAKDTRQRELYAGLTMAAGAASAVVALAGVSPALLTWVLVNPDKAVETGLITAETAAGIVSGAITPGSVSEGLGQNLGRALTAAEKAAVQELKVVLKAVAQQKTVALQEKRVDELVTLFNKHDVNDSLTVGGKSYAATTNYSGTTKTFDTSGVPAKELEAQVFGYARELAGGKKLTAVDAGVWAVKLDDGTTLNVRSVSSSNVSRWTIDVQGNGSLKSLNPSYRNNSYELKFK
ncbi:hemagglutinin repeat-containing protein [Hydrogenophaga sp.]|uniref:hemagglutinin repeat-containing protein n=1 Tax=Hydrogenophaga sp. TaxID=1904254 RepID=UPI0027162001|nr:hemagglutinin repeat-containing protein [Hydrogenophaga sp.]MDO9436644.1 hemagglutinin repeat-containing protein [Hydrogenophaga sp.]